MKEVGAAAAAGAGRLIKTSLKSGGWRGRRELHRRGTSRQLHTNRHGPESSAHSLVAATRENEQSATEMQDEMTDGSFENSQGLKIFTQSWLPGGDPKAVLLWAHGIHEHCGRFEHMYRVFTAAGIAVYTWDHVGHGRSGGKVHQFGKGLDGVVADGMQYARLVRAKHPTTVPIVVGGVSFGGLVAGLMSVEATKAAEDLTFAALLLVAPALDVPMTAILRVQAAIAGLLARLVPNLRMVPAAPLHKLSKCQAALDAYKNDPMIKSLDVRAKVGYEVLQGFKRFKKQWAEVKIPLLVLHGELDIITDNKASARFVDLAGSTDKKFVLLPDTYHLVLHEPDQDTVMGMMKDFIISGTTGATPVEDAVPVGGQNSGARL